jgi:hypothetical protein
MNARKRIVLAVVSQFHHPQGEIRSLMRKGGVNAVVSQPRCPGATREHTDRAEYDVRRQLKEAGLADVKSERLDLNPPVACVLATRSADPVAVHGERHFSGTRVEL